MADSVYFGDMMRTLHEILDELKSMNKKLDCLKEKLKKSQMKIQGKKSRIMAKST